MPSDLIWRVAHAKSCTLFEEWPLPWSLKIWWEDLTDQLVIYCNNESAFITSHEMLADRLWIYHAQAVLQERVSCVGIAACGQAQFLSARKLRLQVIGI